MDQGRAERRPRFPLLLTLDGAKVVVVGGGSVAERKVRSLLECGALVTIVAPKLTEELSRLTLDRGLEHLSRQYRAGDLKGAALAIAAIDDVEVGAAVAAEAGHLNIPVNIVDRPDLCTFIVPAVMRQGQLTIAVSTEGASPAWARRIKEHLTEEFGEEYAKLLGVLADIRRRCIEEIDDPVRRREILQKLADDALLELARKKGREALEADLLERVREWSEETPPDRSG